MGAIITLLAPLLMKLFGGQDSLAGQYIKTKADKAQAQADLALQVQRDKLTLSTVMAQAAVDSERNKLAATGQGFKFVTFCLITLPILITCVAPEYGKRIFDNLNLIPVGWFQLWAAVVGVIWGLPIAANAMSVIFDSIQRGWDIRNQGKIQKIQAMGEAQQIGKEEAKKEIFEVMKKAVGLNGYTQAQVDLINPILEKMLPNVQQPSSSNVTVNTGDK